MMRVSGHTVSEFTHMKEPVKGQSECSPEKARLKKWKIADTKLIFECAKHRNGDGQATTG